MHRPIFNATAKASGRIHPPARKLVAWVVAPSMAATRTSLFGVQITNKPTRFIWGRFNGFVHDDLLAPVGQVLNDTVGIETGFS